MYGDETEIVFINSMKDSFEKCCRFTSITNLHDKYGHGNKLIYPILFDSYYMGHIVSEAILITQYQSKEKQVLLNPSLLLY